MVGLSLSLSAQVVKSTTVGMHNGRKCYIHIVQPGQTVYSITKLYGVKEHEAILKSDIHHIAVDDTVWIPCTDCVVNAQAATKAVSQQPEKKEYQFVVVEPGQTLYSLSKKYNVSIEDLNELNPELRTMGLKAGQTIKVPGRAPSQQPAASSQRLIVNRRLATNSSLLRKPNPQAVSLPPTPRRLPPSRLWCRR